MVSTNSHNDISMESYRVPQVGERKFYRRIPKGTDFQAVTMSDGQRFYMRYIYLTRLTYGADVNVM